MQYIFDADWVINALAGKRNTPRRLAQNCHHRRYHRAARTRFLWHLRHPARQRPGADHHLIEEAGPRILAERNGASDTATEEPLRRSLRPALPALLGDVISEQTLWECTTCRACMQECPVFIEHVPKIVDMRRSLVMMESRFPPKLNDMFRGLNDAFTC